MEITLSLLIATATYCGWSFDWDKGMIVTSPEGTVYTQPNHVEDCPTLEDEGYEYFMDWVDNGSKMPDNCLVAE